MSESALDAAAGQFQAHEGGAADIVAVEDEILIACEAKGARRGKVCDHVRGVPVRD